MDTLPLRYENPYAADPLLAQDTLLFREVPDMRLERVGVPGRLMPFNLVHSDAAILLCFAVFIVLVLLYRSTRHTLRQLLSDFVFTTGTATTDEPRNVLPHWAFCLLTAVELALLFTFYAEDHWSFQLFPLSRAALLGVYVGVALCVVALQQMGYALVHSVFFPSSQALALRRPTVFLFALQAVLLFAVLLATIFFDFSEQNLLLGLLSVLLFIKIWGVFRIFSFFSHEKYGSLHFFVYFCTLEAAPVLLLWSTFVELTNFMSAC